MLASTMLLVAGLVLLVGGADLLVRGVSALAAALGVSPLIIGLTVVAFGTSTPEIVVNTLSAVKGQTGLAFGNIVGACAINIGFVLALTAVLRPLDVEVTVITREIPMMVLGMVALIVLSQDRLLDGAAQNVLNRSDGLMLLLLFCVFLYYIFMQTAKKRTTDPLLQEIKEEAAAPARRSLRYDTFIMLAGLVGVGVGGRMTVSGAVGLAEAFGVSEVVIGLTIVSFGTTLPELTTSLMAARRGHADIAIGNVVGSCIYNILCIGGLVAAIHPVLIPRGGQLDLLVMTGIGISLWPIAMRGPRKISRVEGASLLGVYLAYVTYRTVAALVSAQPG